MLAAGVAGGRECVTGSEKGVARRRIVCSVKE